MMNEFLTHYAKNRKICLFFIKDRFPHARFTDADYDDIVSTAVEKILTKSSLSPNLNTLLYIAHLSAIDLLRKRRKETLVGDFPSNTPLSMWSNEGAKNHHRIESVIVAVAHLNPRHRQLMALKYHACAFDSNTTHEEMIRFKSQPHQKGKTMAFELGYPSETALRQDNFRAVSELRARLAA